jgi:hypothetical protein
MSEDFELKFDEDENKRRVRILVSGALHSSDYIDAQIRRLEAQPRLLSYDRLADISLCTGHVAYEDVIRYGDYWKSVKHLMLRDIRVAVVTDNPLTIARLPMSNLSYPRQVMKAFMTVAEADAWLDQGIANDVLIGDKAV